MQRWSGFAEKTGGIVLRRFGHVHTFISQFVSLPSWRVSGVYLLLVGQINIVSDVAGKALNIFPISGMVNREIGDDADGGE